MTFLMRLAWVCVAALLGCSSGAFEIAPVGDAANDIAFLDSSSGDSGEPMDSALEDSLVADGGHKDGATDTRVSDTAVADTRDSSVIDGGPVDTGKACPAPPTTATFVPPSGLSCSDLETKYKSAVAAAKKCACNADCSTKVARDFCGCETFVNPGNEAYAALDPILNRKDKDMCVTACIDLVCPPVGTGTCKGGLCSDAP